MSADLLPDLFRVEKKLGIRFISTCHWKTRGIGSYFHGPGGLYWLSLRDFAGSVPTIGLRSGPAHGQGAPDGHQAGLLERYKEGGKVTTPLAQTTDL